MENDDFRTELKTWLQEAHKRGAPSVEINAGKLHRAVGGYPGANHRMPVCCAVMYDEQGMGDEVTAAPPKGKGASLTIRYKLPR